MQNKMYIKRFTDMYYHGVLYSLNMSFVTDALTIIGMSLSLFDLGYSKGRLKVNQIAIDFRLGTLGQNGDF